MDEKSTDPRTDDSLDEERLYLESSLKRPSKLSQDLQRLRDATLRVVDTRERLPQPLFWSLFNHQVTAIKKRKKKHRDVQRALFDF